MAGGHVLCEGISPSEAKPVFRVQWAGVRDPGHHVPIAHQAGDALFVHQDPANRVPGLRETVPRLIAAGHP